MQIAPGRRLTVSKQRGRRDDVWQRHDRRDPTIARTRDVELINIKRRQRTLHLPTERSIEAGIEDTVSARGRPVCFGILAVLGDQHEVRGASRLFGSEHPGPQDRRIRVASLKSTCAGASSFWLVQSTERPSLAGENAATISRSTSQPLVERSRTPAVVLRPVLRLTTDPIPPASRNNRSTRFNAPSNCSRASRLRVMCYLAIQVDDRAIAHCHLRDATDARQSIWSGGHGKSW